MYLAIALALPYGFHLTGLGGRMFLPMHLPVLICGMALGPYYGIIVGLLAPVLSHFMTGMPPTYAVPLMTLELPMYALVGGIAYKKLKLNIYISLIAAMIVGRLAFAFGLAVLGLFVALPYGPVQFIAAGGAMLTGWPGILLQIIIVPPLVAAINRATAPAEGNTETVQP